MEITTGSSTPWGPAQHVRQLAPGIYSVDTARHGGIKVSDEKNQSIPEYMRNSSGWYEEDCEWAIPFTALAIECTKEVAEAAYDTLRGWNPAAFEQYYGVKAK